MILLEYFIFMFLYIVYITRYYHFSSLKIKINPSSMKPYRLNLMD